MSVCAKFPLRSMSRSGLKVCGNGGGFQVSTVSNLNPIYIELVGLVLTISCQTYIKMVKIFV